MNESLPLRQLQGELHKEGGRLSKTRQRGGMHSRFGRGGNGSSPTLGRIAPSLLEAVLRSRFAATSDSASERTGRVWE